MKTLMFNVNYGKKFGKKFLPKMYIRLILEELNNQKYLPLLRYLKEELNISKQEIKKFIIYQNICVDKFRDYYVVTFNNVKIKDDLSLPQLVSFINDGNLSIAGYQLFDKVITYINKNINTIYKYYLMVGD